MALDPVESNTQVPVTLSPFLDHHLLLLRESYIIFAVILHDLNIFCIYSLHSFNLFYVLFFFL